MGARGPAPKPTMHKLLAGNPGKRPVNLAEPVPAPSAATPPDWLGDEARRLWFQLAPKMAQALLIRDVDETALGRYVTLLARWLECKTLVEQGKTSIPIRNRKGEVVGVRELPQAAEFRRLGPQLTLLEREFGLTPASRSRIRLEHEATAARDVNELRRKFVGGPGPLRLTPAAGQSAAS